MQLANLLHAISARLSFCCWGVGCSEERGFIGKGSEAAKKAEIEIMEMEMLALKGETRESALKAYQRLLRSVAFDPVYLERSE